MPPPSAVATSVLEEDLRESASIGDADRLTKLLNSGVDINARHALNGWTALHWAAHRGYPTICRLLLQHGADPKITNEKGDTPGKLTERKEILHMLGEPETRNPSHVTSPASTASSHPPSFVPNYLRHPPFPHGRSAASGAPKLASPSSDEATTADPHPTVLDPRSTTDLRCTSAISRLSLESGFNADCSTVTTPSQSHAMDVDDRRRGAASSNSHGVNENHPNHHQRAPSHHSNGAHHKHAHLLHAPPTSSILPPHQHLPYPGYNPDELVVKVRIEGHPDPDFIEVELPRGPGLDFQLLLDILSEELGVPKNLISKVRKRPDTILRKDRDLMRLRDFAELEIVVSQTPCVHSPANGGRYDVPKYGGVEARILY